MVLIICDTITRLNKTLYMKRTIILSTVALALAACCNQPKFDGPTYLNPNAPVEDRVAVSYTHLTLPTIA